MAKQLLGLITAIALPFIVNAASARTLPPGTVTFKYMNGMQINSTSAHADFVPGNALRRDVGYGYGFTQGVSTTTVSIAFNAGAPVLTYATPQVYTAGVAIIPLLPTNAGGAVGSYSAVTSFATVTNSNGVYASGSTGYIYATSTTNNAGYIYNTAGTLIYTQTAAATGYNSPVEIVADVSGATYVANSGAGTVVKLTTSDVLTTIAGFTTPTGLAIDAAGNVYVADSSTGNIYKIATGTSTVTTLLTGFASPWGVAVNSGGDIFVSQTGTNSIIKVANGATGGTAKTTFATGFNSPRGLNVGSAGNIYVADCYNNAVELITPAGIVSTLVSGLNAVTSTGIDASGNLYIANFGGNIQKSVASGYAITSGILPAGLTLNAFTGAISGTPTTPAGAVNVTVTATNINGSNSAVINITIGTAIAWTGGAGTTAWATGGNWSTGTVPGPNDAVSIGVSAYTQPFEPSLTTGNLTVNSLTFGAAHAGLLTVGTGAILTIGNSLTVNTGAAPTLAGTGSGAVNIAPAAIVNITGTGVLTINSPLSFTLKSTSAGSASIGQVTSASITGTGADSIHVERYITGGAGYRGYRLLSSPVYAAIAGSNSLFSLNYLHDHIFITGSSGTSNGFDKAGNPTLYLFREDQTPLNTSFTDGNFWGISNIAPNAHSTVIYSVTGGKPGTTASFNIPAGNGSMLFFRGDRTTVSPYVTTTNPVASTVIATGTLNTGQVIVHNWYTPASANLGWTNATANVAVRGFNLVGNPYASSIDWEQYNTTATTSGIYANNVGTTIYQLNPATNNYATYQVGGLYTNHGSRTVVSGQGFFVQATSNASPQLIFNESAKTATQNMGLNLFMVTSGNMANLENADTDPHLRLQLAKDSINTDDIYVGFNAAASSKYVFNQDAPYMPGNGKVSLSSISSDNVALAINILCLPKLVPTIIRLKVNATADGIYKLNMTEITGIPQLFEIWLMDAYKNDSLDMRHNTTYAFNLNTADTNSFGSKRFSLVIRQNPALGIHLLNFTASKISGGAQLVWETENEQNYTNFTMQRSVDNGATFDVLDGFVSSAIGKYDFLDKNPSAAVDLYRLKIEDMNGTISYSNIIKLIYGNPGNMVNSNINIYPNPAKNIINLTMVSSKAASPNNVSILAINNINSFVSSKTANTTYDIKILNITGLVVKTAVSAEPTWQNDVTNFPPGIYIIQVLNNSDKSQVGEGTFVKL